MREITKRWRSITIGVLVAAYLILVVAMERPLSLFAAAAGIWLIVLILTFLGTFVGVIGVVLQLATRRSDAANPYYHRAYKLGTRNATILASYGLILLREDNPEEAIRCFDRALESTNHFLSTKTLKCNKAIACWKLGDIDKGIDLYLEMLKQFGNDDQKFFTEKTLDQEGIEALAMENSYFYPQDFTTLGFLYMLKGSYEEATFFSKAALEKNSDYAAAYDNLGQIAYYEKDMIRAKDQFDKALALNPNLPDSLYYSGVLAKEHGDEIAAKDFFAKAKACHLDGLNTINYDMIDKQLATL